MIDEIAKKIKSRNRNIFRLRDFLGLGKSIRTFHHKLHRNAAWKNMARKRKAISKYCTEARERTNAEFLQTKCDARTGNGGKH